jgi:hypothetical protein
LLDLVQARAARRAAARAIEEHSPRAVMYSTTTAALLWTLPGVIHFDAPAAGNRPGRHGLWQRPVERRRFAQAPLVVAQSAGGLAEAPSHREALVIPVPVEPSGAPDGGRDVAAVTYAADGVRFAGLLSPEEFRALLRRARIYVTAPRREDYGLAQLEALADGAMLVTTEAPGPYAALPIGRDLDARLVGDDLAGAVRTALDDPRDDYAERARSALLPFRRGSVDALVLRELLPRLVPG